MKERFVHHMEAMDFLENFLYRESVDLFCIDPPYMGIVKDTWDNAWKSTADYNHWMFQHLSAARAKVKPKGSLLVFQGIGRPGEKDSYPIDAIRHIAINAGWHWRNWITWKKRRAYGKSHDYLFCREEIFWFSASPGRTDVTFNIPLTDQLRGYEGWSEKYPALSPYKRVTNVFDDIPELMRPERNCQKPAALMDRLISTHSNPGDFVADCFCGWGSTGVSARRLGRRFVGCEAIAKDAAAANRRVYNAVRLKEKS